MATHRRCGSGTWEGLRAGQLCRFVAFYGLCLSAGQQVFHAMIEQDRLCELDQLRANGSVTEDEYREKRRRILDEL